MVSLYPGEFLGNQRSLDKRQEQNYFNVRTEFIITIRLRYPGAYREVQKRDFSYKREISREKKTLPANGPAFDINEDMFTQTR